MPRVVIIGAGISGLSTAHFLLREDHDLDVLVVEGESRAGGTLGSESRAGFVLERGANGFLDSVPETLELIHDLGIEKRLIAPSDEASARYIYKNGRLHALPSSPTALMRSNLLSMKGRLRALGELFRPKRKSGVEDSVASFGRRHFGDEVVRTLFDPMVSGIFAGDVDRLSLPSAFPKLARMEIEHGSLLRALRIMARERKEKEKREGASTDSSQESGGLGGKLRSFPHGLGELSETLHTRLSDHVRLSWRATALRRKNDRFEVEGPAGEVEVADSVVLALPSYAAGSLFASSDPEVSRALEAIPYAPIGVACFGFPRAAVKHPLDGYGFLVPRDQGLRLLGTIFSSSLFPVHAPPENVSLRCMIGGARDPDALNRSDDHLRELILEELRGILGIEGDPILTRFFRWARGIPQYNIGHRQRVDRIERSIWDLPGLFIAGNAYYGVGVNDCVKEGKRKAQAVRDFFGAR